MYLVLCAYHRAGVGDRCPEGRAGTSFFAAVLLLYTPIIVDWARIHSF